jgi:hypothetical protein
MPNPRHLEPGKTEGVEVVVEQGLLDRAVGASGLTLTFLSCSRDVDDNSCSHNENLDCFGRFGNRPNESDH